MGGTVVSVTRLGVGRDKRTYQNAASLARLGYESIVIEGEPSELDRSQLPFRLITIPGAEPLRPPVDETEGRTGTPGEGIPAALKRIAKGLAVLVDRLRAPLLLFQLHRRDNDQAFEVLPAADLYYLTFFWQFPAVWRKCRQGRVSFIYDANDAYWLWPGYRWYPWLFRAWLRAVERRCVRRASAFITVSEGVAELLERRYRRRPTVIRNVHDLRLDERTDFDLRRALQLGEDDFLLVVVGNDKPSDALEPALEALADLPGRVHLALLGAGYERHLPRLHDLGLGDRVHLVPPVPPTQVTGVIETADAALINTRPTDVYVYGLPTRLFSAIAAGLPVLYPPLPEVRALAEAHGLGLPIDPDDKESIAEAILRLSEDRGLAASYRANVTRGRGELNWEREEARLAEIVKTALRAEG